MSQLYEVMDMEQELELLASENDGEIPEDKYQEFVEKRLKADEQIERLIKYVRWLSLYEANCIVEVDRINAQIKKARSKIESIKKYITPYVHTRGKFSVGTFNLSTRKSVSVKVVENFEIPEYVRIKIEPDKIKIKEALLAGTSITGASLEEKESLQIK